MGQARDELRGLMRRLRQLGPEKRDDFEINEQGTIREQLDPIRNAIAWAGLFITGLALFVGATISASRRRMFWPISSTISGT